MQRDFTFVDDIAEGTVRVLDHIPAGNPAFLSDEPDPGSSYAPYKVYNIGNHQPVELMTFIKTIENALGREARKNFLPMQPGDVIATFADVEDLMRNVGFKPKTTLTEGIAKWVEWYSGYFHQ
jgi:UDP-glucuronate 4-epimerase